MKMPALRKSRVQSTAIPKSAADRAADFFARRAAYVARITDVDQQIAEKSREADSLLNASADGITKLH